MTKEEIENTHKILDCMLSECIIAESRKKLLKRLEEICKLAIKALEQCEVWDGIHGQVVAPKGTFDKIWEDADKAEQEPKTDSDCISRQAAIDAIRRIGMCKCSTNEIKAIDECRRVVEALPFFTAEPKTGHWINDGPVDCYLDKVRCHCSECGKKKNFPADYNQVKQEISISYKYPELIDKYCPNCGCRMSEVSK